MHFALLCGFVRGFFFFFFFLVAVWVVVSLLEMARLLE